MIAISVGPLLLGLLMCLWSDRLAAALAPRLAVPLLTVLALTAALCFGLVLGAVSLLFVAQLPFVASSGDWSARTLRAGSHWPAIVGLLACGWILTFLTLAIIRAVRAGWAHVAAGRAVQRMDPYGRQLLVVNSDVPVAYAVAGLRGHIVVSTSMLAALSAGERRVLLAHEAAHLRHRHHLYLHLVQVAAAANPLIRPTIGAVAHGIERWADEDAAATVQNRSLVAQGLARAAIVLARQPPVPGSLAATRNDVTDRVHALLRPARRPGLHLFIPSVLAAVGCWVACLMFVIWANNLFQVAELAYHRQ